MAMDLKVLLKATYNNLELILQKPLRLLQE
jgi:hypothetical protein